MPEEELEKNKMEDKEEYISLAEAAKSCPYSQDYLSLRARQGKLKSVKLGRNWATKKEWVEDYAASMSEYREDLNNKIIEKGGKPIALKNKELDQTDRKALALEDTSPQETEIVGRSIIPTRKEHGLKFAIVTGLAFLVLLSSLAFWQQALPGRYKQLEVFDDGVAEIFQPIAMALDNSFTDINLAFNYYFSSSKDRITLTYRKGIFQETADIFGSYFNWAKEKLSQLFSPSSELEIVGRFSDANKFLIDDAKLDAIDTSQRLEILRKLLTKEDLTDTDILILKKEIASLKAGGIQTKEIIQEVQTITKIYPKEIIEKRVEVLDEGAKETLAVLKKQIQALQEWEDDIAKLQKLTSKLKATPNTVYHSSAPVYIESQGLQVGGHGTFASLGVSGSGSFKDLGVGDSVTFGDKEKDKMTVYATSEFLAPLDISANFTAGSSDQLLIDTSGNLTTSGNITTTGDMSVSGDFTVTGSQTYSGASTITASSTSPGMLVNQTGTGNIVSFQQAGADKMVIKNNGYLGVGTSSPAYLLDVAGNGRFTGDLIVGGSLTQIGTTTYSGPILFSPDNTYDIGKATTSRARTGYFGTSLVVGSVSASSSYLTFTPNSISGTGTTTIDISTSTLFINTINNRPITFGSGQLIAGGNLDVQSGLNVTGTTTFNSIAYVWPGADGNNTQFLQTDGSGNLTWATSTSGYWTQTGSDIYYTTGRIGIGTSSPDTSLHVIGTSTLGVITGAFWQGNSITNTYIASSTEYLADSDTTYTATNPITLAAGAFGIQSASTTLWATDTNTQLSQATVEDYAGGLWTGNTETRITITYQEADNTLDAVVDYDLANYGNATSSFITSAALANYMQDEDINTFSELQAWVTDEILLASSSINTFAELQAIVADETLFKAGTTTDAKLCTWNNTKGTIECETTDSDTQLTQEQVEDFAGTLIATTTGTHSRISITYDDVNGNMDFIVDYDLANYGNATSSFITTAALANYMQDEDINTFSELQAWVTDEILLASSSINTFAELQAIVADETLFKAGTTTDAKLCTWNNTKATIECETTDSDTQLTQEQVEDFAGTLIATTTGTHSRISITYDDASGNMDFIVDYDLANYGNATSSFITTAALANYMQDEDINTFSELQAWVTDEILLASSSINTFAELQAIVADETLFKAGTTTDAKLCTWNNTKATIECETTDSDTQLTQEQVEDFAGTLIATTTGTHSRISITYDDVNGNMDFIVDYDLANYGNATSSFITSAALANYMQDEDINTFSELQAWVTDEILLASSSINTFAELQAIVADETLFKAGTTTDAKLCTWNNTKGTIECETTDSDTQLTQEQVEDFAGTLIATTTGTHSRISITYDDVNGNMDFIVDYDLANYGNATSSFITTAALANYMQDEDINTFSELQAWVTDEILLASSSINTFAELQAIVADETLFKAGTTTDAKLCTWNNTKGTIECETTDSDTTYFSTSAGLTYLTATTSDLVLGASATSSAPFWLDVSSGNLTITGGYYGTWAGNTILIGTSTDLTASGGITLSGHNIQPDTGFEIPLSASTTQWAGTYTWKSNAIDGSDRLKMAYGGLESDVSGIATGGLISGNGAGSVGITILGTNLYPLVASSTAPNGIAWQKLNIGTASDLTASSGITLTNSNLTWSSSGQSWAGTAIPTQYGGTGQAWNAVTKGSIPYFSGTGVMTTLATGTDAHVLTLSGGLPTWAASAGGGSSEWTDGGTTLYPNEIGDTISIGTTTSNAILTIQGSGATNLLNIMASSSDSALFVSDNGNVGIGTTEPYGNLQISTILDATDNAAWDKFALNIYNPTDDTNEEVGIGFHISTETNGSTNSPGGAITFERTATYSQGSLHFKTKGSASMLDLGTRMSITSDGNVGIGTASPSRKLDVLDSSNPQLRITQDGTTYAEFQVAASTGDLTITLSGDDLTLPDDNLWVCESDGCPIPADLSGTGNLIVEGAIYSGCPSDMVKVGGFCIDKYEASVWSTATGGTQYGTTSDNYPCSDTGNDCSEDAANPVYARSVSGVNPARYITWFQANQACANAGKYLCTNAEWQTAAAGTPDPDTSDPADDSEECNIWSNSKPSAATWATTNETIQTGSASACVSNWGAYDMVGNVWEWTADWWGADSSVNGATTSAAYGSDYMYDVDPADNQGGGSSFPAASIRGGHWYSGSAAGVFALFLGASPSDSSSNVGFRCCR